MLTYQKLARNPSSLRSFTGLAAEEFGKLYEFAESQYPAYELKRLDRKNRINAIGQGRPFKLGLQDKLLMLLMYYRLYITFELEGYLFDLDQGNVCRNIMHIEPLVKRCIPLPEKIHRRTKKIGTIEELLYYYPEMKAFLDTTEQQIPRPKNKWRRKSHYSGKRRKHTVKTQLLVNKRGLIVHKSGYRRGRVHDYTIWKDTQPYIPPRVEVGMDLGYKGIQKDFPSIDSRLPIKKLRTKPLTKKQRMHNRKLSRERVVIEHAISKAKKFNIIGQTFRNRLTGYDTKSSIVSGLVNFRTMLRQGVDVSGFVG